MKYAILIIPLRTGLRFALLLGIYDDAKSTPLGNPAQCRMRTSGLLDEKLRHARGWSSISSE